MNQINLLGVVGANLTSALICLEASKRGIKTLLLDKSLGNIAAEFATQHILAEPTKENIERLMLRVDAVVFCTPTIAYKEQSSKLNVPAYPSKQGIDILNNRAELLELVTNLGVPTPHYYCQNNKENIFKKVDDIQLPFMFYQIYEDRYEAIDILGPEDLEQFLDQVDEEAECWLVEQINDYQKILSITILKDSKGKICAYPIAEEMIGDEEVNYINIPANLTKTMSQKIIRYVKKIAKELDSQGIFNFKFGIQKDKTIELVSINPGIAIGDIATLHHTNMSLYEQYINMICGMDIIEPELLEGSLVTITKLEGEPVGMKLPYHLYVVDKDTQSPIKIYIKSLRETE